MGILTRLFSGAKKPDRLFSGQLPTPGGTVTFDDDQIVRMMPDGKKEAVRWDDLEKVLILTTDQGPAQDDVFWLLVGKSGKCAAPSEATGTDELVKRLQQLPGFDNEMLIKAMGSAENATFLCWKRGD